MRGTGFGKAVFFLFFLISAQLAGLVGSIFTAQSVDTWYVTLNKPVFNPPNWLFGPVWICLYLFMGIAAYLVWKKGADKKKARKAVGFYFIHLLLNAAWSVIFFGLRDPFLAFITIIILWIMILIVMGKFSKFSDAAFYLMIPYILWVTFAGVLNYFIWKLN
jgi:tryptophan-rich sensory protein